MKSEIHVKTTSIKLYLSIGLFLTLVIVFLSVWFRFEMSVILLSVAAVILATGGAATWGRLDDVRFQRRLRHLEMQTQMQRLRQETYKADREEFARFILSFNRTERVIMLPHPDIQIIEPHDGTIITADTPLLASGTMELLPLLDRAERVLIKGASDAGKTTLIQHIASRSRNVVIVDPHFKPGLWPDNCRIVGAGRNFGEISSFLGWLEAELDRRYKLRARGEDNFTAYTVIIDEFMSIAAECERAGRVLSAMIRESRKVGFRLFVCSHSELVRPLGIEGAGDVREGLLIVRLYYSQLRQERRATVDAGEGEQPCQFPPYYGGEAGGTAPELVIEADPEAVKLARWMELVDGGMTKTEATWQVYQKDFSGRFAQELNRRASSQNG